MKRPWLKCEWRRGCTHPATVRHFRVEPAIPAAMSLCQACSAAAQQRYPDSDRVVPLVDVRVGSELHVELELMFLRIVDMFGHPDWDKPVDPHGTGNNPHVWFETSKELLILGASNYPGPFTCPAPRLCPCGATEQHQAVVMFGQTDGQVNGILCDAAHYTEGDLLEGGERVASSLRDLMGSVSGLQSGARRREWRRQFAALALPPDWQP